MIDAGSEAAPRLFTGLALSEEVGGYVQEVIDALSTSVEGVRWVPGQNLHVTLKFLGACEWPLVDRIVAAMREAASLMPVELSVGGVGGFPSLGSARVLWVGADDVEGRLHKVYNILDRGAEKCGFTSERRRYRPHITIGRARKRPVGIPESLALSFDRRLAMKVTDIILYRSVLKSAGAEYSILERISPPGDA